MGSTIKVEIVDKAQVQANIMRAMAKINTNYFEFDANGKLTIKQDTLLAGVNVEKLNGNLASAFASASHVHDDRYYTETESDAKYATISQEDWIAPTLLNSWINYGGGYNPAGYFKDSFGIVHLRGTVKSGTIGQAIFTLPVGYRPAYKEILITISHDGANEKLSRCDVQADGNVVSCFGSNTYYSLDGITFRAV